eukprot:GHRR01035705.1.p1 GENE.GHRR01035705.1~~GHRR01035705.1.p1  ORF type:complete len:126 (-),score=2.42 GHRR01035705.1:217-594(-)
MPVARALDLFLLLLGDAYSMLCCCDREDLHVGIWPGSSSSGTIVTGLTWSLVELQQVLAVILADRQPITYYMIQTLVMPSVRCYALWHSPGLFRTATMLLYVLTDIALFHCEYGCIASQRCSWLS